LHEILLQMNEVDVYIANFEKETQERLRTIRRIILQHAPMAVEGFAYKMPSYKVKGKPLVYFAAFKSHIGFYATPTGHSAFEQELSAYKQGKGSVQFPNSLPLPIDLIQRIVLFRLSEVLEF